MSSVRQTYYPGQQPIETQFLQYERDSAKTLWQFVSDSLGGTSSVFTGLLASPGTGLTVAIASGSVYQLQEADATAWSSLSADTSSWLQIGLSSGGTLSGFAAATSSGMSIDYLIEAQIQVTDSAAVATNFYNSTTPSNPTVLQKSQSRQNLVVFQVKAGTQATTGTQVAPSADAGWIPLWSVTVDYGESSLVSNDIVLASSAPQWLNGFVKNTGATSFVQLSPGTAQSGFINVSGAISGSTIVTTGARFGGASVPTNFQGAWASGFSGDYLALTKIGWTGSKQATDSLNIAGSIGYTGTHAGTDGDPYPLSQLNVAMLGGKLPSDYALASGNYLTVYAGAPTLATGNAGVTGYLQSGVATGTAPLVVASTTMVTNFNANFVNGYSAGNSSGNVPISNGTLNSNLNAQYLNGLASSAFQPAGNYAAMNATNTGYFEATSYFASTGGQSGIQMQTGYSPTNGWGINSGGAVSYLQSTAAPLALIGSSIRTNAPLYVGDSTRQSVYLQDLVPSGMVRAGLCPFRVTWGGANYSYPVPGQGTDFGYTGSSLGEIDFGRYETWYPNTTYIGFRCKVTFSSSVTVNFNWFGDAGVAVYVNGSRLSGYTLPNAPNGAQQSGSSYTFGAGTYTIDVVVSYNGGGGQGISSTVSSARLFGWLPMGGGQLSAAIASIVPG